MAVDCGTIRAAVGLADNHVSRGYGPGLGCDGQLTGVGDKTEEERPGDGTGRSWRIPAILAWRTLAVMSAKGAMTGGASVSNSRGGWGYSVSANAMRRAVSNSASPRCWMPIQEPRQKSTMMAPANCSCATLASSERPALMPQRP